MGAAAAAGAAGSARCCARPKTVLEKNLEHKKLYQIFGSVQHNYIGLCSKADQMKRTRVSRFNITQTSLNSIYWVFVSAQRRIMLLLICSTKPNDN